MIRRRLLLAGNDPNLICDLHDYTPETIDFSPGLYIDLSRPWAAEFDVSSVSDAQSLSDASYAFFALNNGSTNWLYYIKVFSGSIQIIMSSITLLEISTSISARRAKRLTMELRQGAMSADRNAYIEKAEATMYATRAGTTPYGPFTATPKTVNIDSVLNSPANVQLSARFFYNRLKLYYTD